MKLFVQILLFASSLHALADTPNPFIGDWALKMANGQAGWLTFHEDQQRMSGELRTVGQSKKISDISLHGNILTFTRNCKIGTPDYPGGPPSGKPTPCKFTATLQEDAIIITRPAPVGSAITHTGKRMPPLPPKPAPGTIKFGAPIPLFNGSDLTGWKLTNPKQKNGWKVVDGLLINETPKKTFDPFSHFGNLRTDQTFGDGKLHIEFNVPSGGNSGIYLRGAYEAQVVDRDSRMQGIQGVGAIFGRIPPSRNAGKPGGVWQSYDITIVDRHATVVLNGETVIDNQPIPGSTNGAIQSDITSPGPLMLQGDHTSVKYRNITFHPAIAPKKILFIGNSYTGGIKKSLTELFRNSPHADTQFTFINPGGKNLAFHLKKQKTIALIKHGNFDCVVLQDQSQTPAIFPERFQNAALSLDKIIDQSGAQTVFYQTWGRRDGDKQNPQKFLSYQTMQAALTESYATAARACDALVAPVGESWSALRQIDPDLGRALYAKDGSHPSNKGAYLAACVFYALLVGEDPRTITFTGNLSEEEAGLIQKTVFDQIPGNPGP